MGMGSMLKEVQDLAEKFKAEDDENYISPYTIVKNPSDGSSLEFSMGNSNSGLVGLILTNNQNGQMQKKICG